MKIIGALVNLILLAGATLLFVFIVLSGSTDHFPFNRFYWLSADTSGIPNAYAMSSWTFWGLCDSNDLGNCSSGPAYPISPVDNFQTVTGVPADFIDNKSTYFYLSKFAFAFFLIALAFSAIALITSLLSFCFTVIDKVLVFLVAFGLFFSGGAAAFETAVVVLAKNAFSSFQLQTTVGVKLMALTWTAFVCLLIVFFITCAANITNSYKKHIERVNESKGYNNEAYMAENRNDQIINDESSFTRGNAVEEKNDAESGGIRFFRIKRPQKPSDDESVN